MMESHPDYACGFGDASQLTPLFEGECSPEYEAGWWAYWSCLRILDTINI